MLDSMKTFSMLDIIICGYVYNKAYHVDINLRKEVKMSFCIEQRLLDNMSANSH